MSIVNLPDRLNSGSARKKFGIRAGGTPGPNACIYQQRQCIGGKKTIKMSYYTPTNPQTVPQQANRSKFSNAVAGWQALSENQKEVYNERAKYKQYSGYNLYIREFMYS